MSEYIEELVVRAMIFIVLILAIANVIVVCNNNWKDVTKAYIEKGYTQRPTENSYAHWIK